MNRPIEWVARHDRIVVVAALGAVVVLASFQKLIENVEAGQPLSEFLEDFPTVSKETAMSPLEQAKKALLARLVRPRKYD